MHRKKLPVLLSTFTNYLFLLTKRTERHISATVFDSKALVFQAQTTLEARHYEVFPTYSAENKITTRWFFWHFHR